MQKNYLEILKEFKTLPGIGEVEEIEFEGIPVYTSNRLKENIKKITNKYLDSLTSNVINRLIDSNKIIPVFISKNLISYLKRKYKKTKISNVVARTTIDGYIYLFLEHFYSLLKISSINERYLITIILHELIHLSEFKNKREFYRNNIEYIIRFYYFFFLSYLQLNKKIPNKIFNELLNRILESKQKGIINFQKVYIPLFKECEKYTSLSDDEYLKRYNLLINYLDNQIKKFSLNVPSEIWLSSQDAYINLTGKKNETIGQEFWSPSEIISVISELDPKHESIKNSVKLLV